LAEVTFLGVGSATPAEPGDHVALLVRVEGRTILVDAGPTVMVQLGRLGLGADDVDTLLVTHAHGDHVLGWPMLLFRQTLLDVVASPSVLETLQTLATLVYPELGAQLHEQVRFHPIESNEAWELTGGRLLVRATASDHNHDSLAYRLDLLPIGCSLTYSGDTGPSRGVARLARNCDLLIHEATYLYPRPNMYRHSSAGQAAEIAALAECMALALVHRDGGEPQVLELYEAEVRRYFEGTWWLPCAGQTCTISAAGLKIV